MLFSFACHEDNGERLRWLRNGREPARSKKIDAAGTKAPDAD